MANLKKQNHEEPKQLREVVNDLLNKQDRVHKNLVLVTKDLLSVYSDLNALSEQSRQLFMLYDELDKHSKEELNRAQEDNDILRLRLEEIVSGMAGKGEIGISTDDVIDLSSIEDMEG